MIAADEMTLATKREILAEFIRRKNAELDSLRQAQREQLDSANQEDIDKQDPVESPKAQMMDEIELQATQLDRVQDDLQILHRLDVATVHDRVTPGSLVRTNVGYFLVGVAVPPSDFGGKKITGISTASPLYQKMQGLKAHAEFHLGSIEYVISAIT
ncbi:MAG: hypothetical protein ICV83_17420 [Cytophagales bacterium]|nr:hypothetical protein [Cytophagales bacterium]